MSGLTIRNVIKRYGEVQVMHGVDLDISEASFASLWAHPVAGNPPCFG